MSHAFMHAYYNSLYIPPPVYMCAYKYTCFIMILFEFKSIGFGLKKTVVVSFYPILIHFTRLDVTYFDLNKSRQFFFFKQSLSLRLIVHIEKLPSTVNCVTVK